MSTSVLLGGLILVIAELPPPENKKQKEQIYRVSNAEGTNCLIWVLIYYITDSFQLFC